MDGQKDNIKTVYPPNTVCGGGYKNIIPIDFVTTVRLNQSKAKDFVKLMIL